MALEAVRGMDSEHLQERGEVLIDAIGGVPPSYAMACDLPGVHGDPLSELERVWMDRFEEEGYDWLVVLNGYDRDKRVEALDLIVEGGAAVVACDETLLVKLTPLGVLPYFNPDTGDQLSQDEEAFVDWRWEVLWALHARLTAKGKDLPPLYEMMSDDTSRVR